MPSDGITYLKLLPPGIFYAIPGPDLLPKKIPVTLRTAEIHCLEIAVFGTWLPKTFGCITRRKSKGTPKIKFVVNCIKKSEIVVTFYEGFMTNSVI